MNKKKLLKGWIWFTKKTRIFTNPALLCRQQHLRATSWLEEKEAVLNNDDLGDRLADLSIAFYSRIYKDRLTVSLF